MSACLAVRHAGLRIDLTIQDLDLRRAGPGIHPRAPHLLAAVDRCSTARSVIPSSDRGTPCNSGATTTTLPVDRVLHRGVVCYLIES